MAFSYSQVHFAVGTKSWERDGLRLLDHHQLDDNEVRLFFSTKANVAPTFIAQRAKG